MQSQAPRLLFDWDSTPLPSPNSHALLWVDPSNFRPPVLAWAWAAP